MSFNVCSPLSKMREYGLLHFEEQYVDSSVQLVHVCQMWGSSGGLSAKDVTACFVSLSSFLVNGGSDSVSWTGSITAANRASPSTQLRHAPGETYYISFIMSFQHTSIYCDLYYIFWPVIYIRSLLNRSILSLVIWFITYFIMIGLYYFHFM